MAYEEPIPAPMSLRHHEPERCQPDELVSRRVRVDTLQNALDEALASIYKATSDLKQMRIERDQARREAHRERSLRRDVDRDYAALESWVDLADFSCERCEDRLANRDDSESYGFRCCWSCAADIERSREEVGYTVVRGERVS